MTDIIFDDGFIYKSYINNASMVYQNLSDGLSKLIFKNRLLYSLTNERELLNEIIDHSPMLVQVRNEVLSCMNKRTINNVIIYGAGFRGAEIEYIIKDHIKIAAFCDRNVDKQKNGYLGYPVISLSELEKNHFYDFIVISCDDYSEILSDLISIGFNSNQIFILYKLYNKLLNSMYFDMFNPTDNETFIDAGSYNCFTSIKFTDWSFDKYSKIFAFEPNPKQYQDCLMKTTSIRDITVYPYGLWSANTELELVFDADKVNPSGAKIINNQTRNTSHNTQYDTVKTVRLDDIIKEQEVSFIKMDIEGSELEALKGAKQTIIKYHPKLAISVYHKPEDILVIPSYILSLNNEYKFYIRHYTYSSWDTVLYAFI